MMKNKATFSDAYTEGIFWAPCSITSPYTGAHILLYSHASWGKGSNLEHKPQSRYSRNLYAAGNKLTEYSVLTMSSIHGFISLVSFGQEAHENVKFKF